MRSSSDAGRGEISGQGGVLGRNGHFVIRHYRSTVACGSGIGNVGAIDHVHHVLIKAMTHDHGPPQFPFCWNDQRIRDET